MRAAVVPVCLVVIAAGAVFLGQGVGLISGSFMTGSGTWAVIGAVMIVAGVGTMVLAARRGST
jgi:hypothetical protein